MEFKKNPEISIRRLAVMYPNISKSSLWNILHKKNLYPFYFRKIQAMYDGNYPRRVDFSN